MADQEKDFPSDSCPRSEDTAAMQSETCVVQKAWSTLSKDAIVDKIKGLIYGQALGDAIGLATEFMSKAQAESTYGKEGPSSFDDIVTDYHRHSWKKGDWTDDTDQMLLIMLGVIESRGAVSELDFAWRLKEWTKRGFPELGDQGGCGIGRTVWTTVRRPEFKKDPHKAARDTWESSGRFLAANGAVMRTSILGALNFNDIDKVIENTKRICLVTHADPRCLASCVAVTTAIALMLAGADSDESIEKSLDFGLKCLGDEQYAKEMRNYVSVKSLDELELDEEHTIGYTFKTLGSGFYGLRHCNDYWKTIMELIMEAGDADTNAAVCGALLGCKLGYKSLPAERLAKMPHVEWLEEKVTQFLTLIGLTENKD
ncbi:ADP-ribosylarginine hydrolase Tri1-like [Oscarella lobularis]|uniref:ADP-ribosylarginine hydrolase Tri1-like n=1 Tax=Oscarella lobularis TaxID=121494 RepID=UPI00331318D8